MWKQGNGLAPWDGANLPPEKWSNPRQQESEIHSRNPKVFFGYLLRIGAFF